MEKALVGVVEDELIIADNIIDSLRSLGYDTVGPAMNFTEGLEMLEKDQPDILLLDIILSGSKDGIDLAWKIREDYNIPFIFLTSHADKATVDRAKQVDPPAYLVKPFNKDELYSAIEIAMFNHVNHGRANNANQHISEQSDYLINNSLFIKDKDCFHKIRFDDILFLKNDHVYIHVQTVEKSYLVRSNMSEYLKKLPAQFFRVHRSFAINTHHLDAIDGEHVVIREHRLPITRNYKRELLSKIAIG